jgi:5-methylcytosine-specific restriction endonuclease McrBC regulatory subunit McrC
METSYQIIYHVLVVKCQDIDDPSLTVKNARTSITLAKSFSHFLPATAWAKIILGENGPIKKLVGDQDDFLRIQFQGFVGKW